MSGKHHYELYVGNIGKVYDGESLSIAVKTYDEYVERSKLGVGRASGETVTLLCDGAIRCEHNPTEIEDL